VVFVLATTEYEKLPATITSRTQRFIFKKLTKSKILSKLRLIATEEKIDIEPAALELVAAAAEGSLRDAESLLDQLSSVKGKIDLATAERLTGRVGFKKVDGLAELLLKDELEAALKYLSEVNEEGHNLVQLTRDLIHYLRKILALKLAPALEEAFHGELTGEELARVKSLGALMEPERGVALIKALIRAYTEMRYSPFAMVPLEMVLVENLKSK